MMRCISTQRAERSPICSATTRERAPWSSSRALSIFREDATQAPASSRKGWTLDMTATSLNSYEFGKGRAAMFLTSWFFVIGSLLLLARLAVYARRFTQAFVDAVKPSAGTAADQTAGTSFLSGAS